MALSPQSLFVDQLKDLIHTYDSSESRTPYFSPQDTRDNIPLRIQDASLPPDALLEILKEVIRRTPKTASDTFYNQLFGGKERRGYSRGHDGRENE